MDLYEKKSYPDTTKKYKERFSSSFSFDRHQNHHHDLHQILVVRQTKLMPIVCFIALLLLLFDMEKNMEIIRRVSIVC